MYRTYMRWFGVCGFVVAFGACGTRPNPAVLCNANNPCIDPNFPFCDADGECIAVSCNAGDFGGCEGSNTTLVCNSTGTSFDREPCLNGCDESVDGCVTCTPGDTLCKDGQLVSCEESGAQSSAACVLDCADETRCQEVSASNNLDALVASVTDPQDLTLDGDGVLDLATGTYTQGSVSMPLPSFDVAGAPGGAPIRLFVVKKLTLGTLTIIDGGANNHAAAFVAIGDTELTGTIHVRSGAVSFAGCNGGDRDILDKGTRTGGGGGAHAGDGGDGGAVSGTSLTAGSGGVAGGNPTLVPLRGGCPGGDSVSSFGGAGGGALQVTSKTRIAIAATVAADGDRAIAVSVGGGGGGGLLFEAPVIDVDGSSILLVRGGGGASGSAAAPVPALDGSAAPGGTCGGASACGNGGQGAAANTGATDGQGAVLTSGHGAGGGGGGGVGFIRFNTKQGTTPTIDPAAILAGSVSTGAVGTK